MDKNIKTINKIHGKCIRAIPLLRKKYGFDIKNIISAIDPCNKCYIQFQLDVNYYILMQIFDKYFVISVFPSKYCNEDSFKTFYTKNYEYKQHIKSSSVHYFSKYIKSLSVSKFANIINLLARTRWGLDLL